MAACDWTKVLNFQNLDSAVEIITQHMQGAMDKNALNKWIPSQVNCAPWATAQLDSHIGLVNIIKHPVRKMKPDETRLGQTWIGSNNIYSVIT